VAAGSSRAVALATEGTVWAGDADRASARAVARTRSESGPAPSGRPACAEQRSIFLYNGACRLTAKFLRRLAESHSAQRAAAFRSREAFTVSTCILLTAVHRRINTASATAPGERRGAAGGLY